MRKPLSHEAQPGHAQRGPRVRDWLAALPLALVLTGCPGGTLDNPDAFGGATSSTGGGTGGGCDAVAIFEQKCAGAPCHTGSDAGGGVDLTSDGVAERILDLDAVYPGLSDCPDPPEKIIDSSSVEASLLLTKINGTQDCGLAMPIGPALTDDEMTCLEEWAQDVADGN